MKNIKLLIIVFITVFFSSCEEVIHVDLNTAAPRLVIEARIVWDKGTNGNLQVIKLTTSTGFYETEFPTVSNAVVTVKNNDGAIFEFLEKEDTGLYICNNFVPVIGQTYNLTVIVKDEIYTATEILQSVVPFNRVKQIENGGFFNDQKEVRAFFTDPSNVQNFYLTEVSSPLDGLSYGTINDEFFNGNETSIRYSHEDLAAGNVIYFKLYGISREYHNYLNILINAVVANPFQPPSGVIRGNIVNNTNFDNYCFGFFSLSEASSLSYEVE